MLSIIIIPTMLLFALFYFLGDTLLDDVVDGEISKATKTDDEDLENVQCEEVDNLSTGSESAPEPTDDEVWRGFQDK